MGKSSSADLRVRIVGEIERGQSCGAAVWGCAEHGDPVGAAQGADGIAGSGQAGPLAFIDETGTNTKMTRLRGRCRAGNSG